MTNVKESSIIKTEYGVGKYVWICENLLGACDYCRDRHGEYYNWDGEEDYKLYLNCKCRLVPTDEVTPEELGVSEKTDSVPRLNPPPSVPPSAPRPGPSPSPVSPHDGAPNRGEETAEQTKEEDEESGSGLLKALGYGTERTLLGLLKSVENPGRWLIEIATGALGEAVLFAESLSGSNNEWSKALFDVSEYYGDPKKSLAGQWRDSIDERYDSDSLPTSTKAVGWFDEFAAELIGSAAIAKLGKTVAEAVSDRIAGVAAQRIARPKGNFLIPPDEYKELLETAIHNPSSDVLTLGENTGRADSYIARAGDSSYFDMGDEWKRIMGKYGLTEDQMFDHFNLQTLEKALTEGKTIRFTHDPRRYSRGGIVDEWNYIKEILNLIDADLIFEGGFWYVP